MYGHWLRPPTEDGVDHVHTCTTCLDDVECDVARLDCCRYLGLTTGVYRCGGCLAAAACRPVEDQAVVAFSGGQRS